LSKESGGHRFISAWDTVRQKAGDKPRKRNWCGHEKTLGKRNLRGGLHRGIPAARLPEWTAVGEDVPIDGKAVSWRGREGLTGAPSFAPGKD